MKVIPKILDWSPFSGCYWMWAMFPHLDGGWTTYVRRMGPCMNRNLVWSTPANLQPHLEGIHALFLALSEESF